MSPNAAPIPNQDDHSPAQALFFSNPQPVHLERHAKAGLRAQTDFAFAKEINSIPITVLEFVEVSRSYPIVFSDHDIPLPIAVVGLENRNLFINNENQWDKMHYIPSYVRKYPFGFTLMSADNGEEGKFALCVDEASPHFMSDHADIPFFADESEGELSEMSRQALQYCGQYQQQYQLSMAFSRAAKAAGLFEKKHVEITLNSGEKKSIGGFYVIDTEAWERFAATNIAEWHRKGYAAMAILALMSQCNWKYLSQRQQDA